MAKAYICDKCGKAFDKHDCCFDDEGIIERYGHPLILKFTDEMMFEKKCRDWHKRVFCAKCSVDIMKCMSLAD